MLLTHTHSRRRARSAGMTILELLAYIAALIIITNVSLKAFIDISRLSSVAVTTLDKAKAVQELEKDFVTSVRDSRGVVDDVGSYRTTDKQLVLLQPDRENDSESRHYIIWGIPDKYDRIVRLGVEENKGTFAVESCVNYPVSMVSAAFEVSPGARTLVSLKTTPAKATGNGRAGADRTMIASMRCSGELTRGTR